MELVRFYSLVIKIAILLALVGQLKTCTLELMGLAANKTERGMISYKRYTEALTREPNQSLRTPGPNVSKPRNKE